MSQSYLTITILGFGGIGRAICFNLISSLQCFEINIIDCDESVSGAIEDIKQANQVSNRHKIRFNKSDFIAKSDFIFHTAGIGVSKDKDRNSVLSENELITKELFEDVTFKKSCKIIVITNPVDAITYFTWKYSGLNENQVVGVGTFLDSARMTYFLSKYNPGPINCILLGEHGRDAVYCKSLSSNVDGISEDIIEKCLQETILAARSIKKYGDASIFGVSACAIEMFYRMQSKQGALIPVSTTLSPKSEIFLESKNVAISLLSLVNSDGAIPVSFDQLTQTEQNEIKASTKKIEASIQSIEG